MAFSDFHSCGSSTFGDFLVTVYNSVVSSSSDSSLEMQEGEGRVGRAGVGQAGSARALP